MYDYFQHGYDRSSTLTVAGGDNSPGHDRGRIKHRSRSGNDQSGARVMSEAKVDVDLLDAIKAGDRDALGALYDLYVPRLMPIALRILRNHRDAEDLIHDVFVEVWRCIGKYDAARGTVRAWISLRVRSRAIDRLRSQRRAADHATQERDAAPPLATASDKAALSVDCLNARAALESLAPKFREVIELGYYRGLSCSEIAMRCGIPLGTVKSRLASAISKLRKQLAPAVDTV